MMCLNRPVAAAFACALLVLSFTLSPAWADSAGEIDRDVQSALATLFSDVPGSRSLREEAVATLVFPNIVKGGFFVGGQFGEGALLKGDQTAGHYNIVSASVGLQAGAQSYKLAIMFMDERGLRFFQQSEGFELGVDLGVTVADEGLGGDISSATVQDPIIAFVFGERGFMGGISVEGGKSPRSTNSRFSHSA